MGIKTVAIYSDVDASSVSIFLLYLNQDVILGPVERNDRCMFSSWFEKSIHNFKKSTKFWIKQNGSIMSSMYVLFIFQGFKNLE